MKTLIILKSVHHMNTEKIAKAMAMVMEATIAKPEDLTPAMLAEYDMIGFGSGIYFGKFHKTLLTFIDSLPTMSKDAFVFSTNGAGRDQNGPFIEQLKKKGFNVKGSFTCAGFDTFGPFKLIGGMKKGHPDEKDLNDARAFAERILK